MGDTKERRLSDHSVFLTYQDNGVEDHLYVSQVYNLRT